MHLLYYFIHFLVYVLACPLFPVFIIVKLSYSYMLIFLLSDMLQVIFKGWISSIINWKKKDLTPAVRINISGTIPKHILSSFFYWQGQVKWVMLGQSKLYYLRHSRENSPCVSSLKCVLFLQHTGKNSIIFLKFCFFSLVENNSHVLDLARDQRVCNHRKETVSENLLILTLISI